MFQVAAKTSDSFHGPTTVGEFRRFSFKTEAED